MSIYFGSVYKSIENPMPQGPIRPYISYSNIPNEYISPFCDPRARGKLVCNNSGADVRHFFMYFSSLYAKKE
jgi:hypothetical protein